MAYSPRALDIYDEPAPGKVTAAYFQHTLGFAIVFVIIAIFWGSYIKYDLGSLIRFDAVGLAMVWPIFIWAGLFALIGKGRLSYRDKSSLVGRATWVALNAGFWEELVYRFFNFAANMALLVFFNWITFGLVHWLYMNLFLPVSNWLTFGLLEPQLYAVPWTIGAAIVNANADFRRGHAYLGLFGLVNSWFLGMVFFWLMFHYGLVTAMVAHAAYDMVLMVTRALKSDRVGLVRGRVVLTH